MPPAPRPKKLLDQMCDVLRTQHDAIRTENASVDWAKRFILLHQKRHPQEMGRGEIDAFLTHLAVDRHIAASTHNQALSALLFLYKAVLRQEVGAVDAVRARKPQRLPTVLTKAEALEVLHAMVGVPHVMAKLLYGSGGRGLECVRVRVNEVDCAQHLLLVRDGKGDKDRITLLPETLVAPLQEHLGRVQQLHTRLAKKLKRIISLKFMPPLFPTALLAFHLGLLHTHHQREATRGELIHGVAATAGLYHGLRR
jgi:site-specific recombinase XerD